MRFLVRALVGAAVGLPSCFAAIYEHWNELPTLAYDYIVVGGGTAGNVIANRLTENPHVSVLVLEAGITNKGLLASQIPLLGPSLAPDTPVDWNYTTVPQSGLNGRSIPYPRGRVLGGSSSINYMVYNRGSADDWDAYARSVKDSSWSWSNVQKWFAMNERYVAPNDDHNTTGQYKPSAHSTSGLVSVSLPGYPVPPDSRVIATTEEFPEQFPYQEDMNAGNTIGVGWVQATVGHGERSSSATAYLALNFIERPNLSVLVGAQVTKILKTGLVDHLPVFGAVQFAPNASAAITTATACKEIILSAGSFNSPKLLMLSGVGDKTELARLGIDTIVDLPSVGKNMSDHTLLANAWHVKSNDTFSDHLTPAVIGDEIARWNKTRKGPLSYTICNQIAWLRLDPNDSIFARFVDPAAGPLSAHYELIFANGFAVPGQATPAGEFMTIFSNVISPISRGTVTLASSDPWEDPLIDPNFLGSDFDLHVMTEAVKAAKKFVGGTSWRGFIEEPWGALAETSSAAELKAYARGNSGSVWHAVGTAAMSAKDAPWGVVDPDLTVKGTVGLRVVDASVVPFVPTGHTQGAVYVFAEHAASLITGS